MEPDTQYIKWKEKRSDVSVPTNFSTTLIQKIHGFENQPAKSSALDFLSEIHFLATRTARLAFAFGLASLGIYRISYIFASVLIP